MDKYLGFMAAVILVVLCVVGVSIQNSSMSLARARAEAENIVRVENIGERPIGMPNDVPDIPKVWQKITTRDLFEVEWNRDLHKFVGTYRGHCIYTDSFRVWCDSWHEENGEDVCTWTEATEVIGVYLGNQAEVYVLIDSDEEEHTAYQICLHRDVDRLDVLDEDGNRIVSLR